MMRNYTLKYQAIIVILTLLVLFNNKQSLANASQPGVWNAGGTIFTMLYPEDSHTFKKVQMQEEKIYIQLYKGYAVVKGNYTFKNTSQDHLEFKMGYPVNGIYYGGNSELNEVNLDSLSQFKIKAKGNWLPLAKKPNAEYGAIQSFSDNWMVWDMHFAPQESQQVEVYFIVNTNNAHIRKGYSINNYNAFIYLIESGAVWKQPIQKGHFYIQLMDELDKSDIKGLSDGFGFRYNELHKLYAGSKSNFEPTRQDNLVLTYSERNELFDFEPAISQSEQLFNRIDQLSSLDVQNLKFKTIVTNNPYEVNSTFWSIFPEFIVLFIIYFPIIIGVIISLIAIWTIIKWNRIRSNPFR